MAKIQLYINNQLVDVTDDMDILLDKDFSSDKHVIEEVNYSFDIDIPITINNKKIFGYIDNFDTPNKFGKTYNARLNADDVTLLEGKFIMNNIDNDNFSGNLYVPSSQTLKDVLGDMTLNKIIGHNKNISTWDDINKINNYIVQKDNMKDSSDWPVKEQRDNHICFPYCLYRIPYNSTASTFDNYTQDLSASGSSFTIDNFPPAYNVLSVIKDCFATEGYSVQGNIFTNSKFTELYQTFSCDYDTWHKEKNTPYYTSFSVDYKMFNNSNISPTLQQIDIMDNYTVGTDAPLVAGSKNTRVYNEDDPYNLLIKSSDGEGYTLRVPKAGWYQIHCDGKLVLPQNSGHWGQQDRVNVTGIHSDSDWTDLHNNPIEFQIKKTETPLSRVDMYCQNWCVPCVPTQFDKDNYINNGIKIAPFMNMGLGGVTRVWQNEQQMKFGKNGKTTLIKDYSGFSTDDFIAGASFGSAFNYRNLDDDRFGNRRSEQPIALRLPDPSNADESKLLVDQDNKPYLYLFNSINWNNWADCGPNRAQVMVRSDSYSNFEGYNVGKVSEDETQITWDTTSNPNKMTWEGQANNSASTKRSGNVNGNDINEGDFNINTCVWLEEGDCISFEIIAPYHDWRDSCGWLEFCDWKHRGNSGICIENTQFNFEMAIVSSTKEWIPSNDNPIPPISDSKISKTTNVNKFLPDIKVNDYLENFLTTFNLKLTKVNNNLYSIDSQDVNNTIGEIIDIDKYANIKDAKFERIDMPSETVLAWTISTEEEGYKHGNNSISKPRDTRDNSGYTGSLTIVGDETSQGKEEKIKSNWSYNWYKSINFVNAWNGTEMYSYDIPVIASEDAFKKIYSSDSLDMSTDKTSRFMYLSKNMYGTIKTIPIMGFKNDSKIEELKCNIIIPSPYISSTDINGVVKKFYLDYNQVNAEDTITTTFFKINDYQTYRINVPVTLPNFLYPRLKPNTLIKFNDGLYRVLELQGHDVSEKDEATLSLTPFK
jgi:hypothetical protein